MHIINPGLVQGVSNETIQSYHLVNGMLVKPEILPQVATLFRGDEAPFTALLAEKGNIGPELYTDMNSKNWKVVGNRKVMAAVEGVRKRKGVIVDIDLGNFPDTPGWGGDIIGLYLNTDWFSPKDVLELADNRTYVTVVDDLLPREEAPDKWLYYVRMNRTNEDEYIRPSLLEVGKEVGFAYTNFEEMSETAYEKYTFNSWAWTWMTIQRMKFSISGTAAAMKTEKVWLSHSGEFSFIDEADMQMLRRWASARERQIVDGKGTVDENDKVLLHDLKNRDIIAGSGIVHCGDGSLRFPYNGKLTKAFLLNIMKTMKLFSNGDGTQELAVLCGMDAYWQFGELMADVIGAFGTTSMVEGTGANKGVNATFKSYEFMGVRFVPILAKWFSDPERPTVKINGNPAGSYRMIFVSLGSNGKMKNVQLVQLGDRGFKRGSVAGIDKGGDGMKTSVDATHTHILTESGCIVLDLMGIAEAYVPVK